MKEMKKEKIVITYGTFDMFHIGHLNLLQRAKKLGDRLIVAVSTDEFNSLKNKKSVICYKPPRKTLLKNQTSLPNHRL